MLSMSKKTNASVVFSNLILNTKNLKVSFQISVKIVERSITELDLQSIESSPDLHRGLLQAHQIQCS